MKMTDVLNLAQTEILARTIITTGVTVEYFFADNTNSTSKSDFWSINPYTGKQNAQQLFGLSQPLPANMGLAGKMMGWPRASPIASRIRRRKW